MKLVGCTVTWAILSRADLAKMAGKVVQNHTRGTTHPSRAAARHYHRQMAAKARAAYAVCRCETFVSVGK